MSYKISLVSAISTPRLLKSYKEEVRKITGLNEHEWFALSELVEQVLRKWNEDPEAAVGQYLEELPGVLRIEEKRLVLQAEKLTEAAVAGRQEFERAMYDIALDKGVIAA